MQKSNKFLTTKQVAELLDVSDMTVKRWADNGYIPCLRVGVGQYRRFKKDAIIKFKEEFYNNQIIDATKNIEARVNELMPINSFIPPKSHPKHYLMHKYWGRKAHNVISEYISHFTKENDVVLDPFMGSGVTVIESVKLNRKSIGVDINPTAISIVENTLKPVDLSVFKYEYERILNTVNTKYKYLYDTKCPICQESCSYTIMVWENDEAKRVRGICPTHGKFKCDVNEEDLQLIEEYKNHFLQLDQKGDLIYPKDAILQYVRRNKKTYIYELFTERALLIISSLLKEVDKVEDPNVKSMLMFSISSMLPNVSKMLPGDIENVMYKSGWVISKFWVPKVHTERNVFDCFKMRCEAIFKGKSELLNINNKLADIHNRSSTNLQFIESESVDYIFTDPPYGESIAYLALSHFWNSWFHKDVNYEEEIILDPYRKKTIDEFESLISDTFKELYRVLKPNKYLSFTFHNRDLKVWKAILEGTVKAGFELVNIVMQPQAVSSGTQGINRDNTLKGDFVYNFRKVSPFKEFEINYMKNSEPFIINSARNLILEKQGVNSAELYEYILPLIAKNQAYMNDKNEVINVENLLKKHFKYEEDNGEYKWLCQDMVVKNSNKLNVLDLFSGAGGFSEGFKEEGFNIVAAVEFDSQIAQTYLYNNPETFVFNEDITQLKTNDIKKIFSNKSLNCDVIIGGPPCQGFSMAGNRIRNQQKLIEDPRNELFKEFYRMVKDFRPKVFIFENVEGILNFSEGRFKEAIFDLFRELGYHVSARILNAADYGVPQLRKRAIFIGNRLGLNSDLFFPESTHAVETYVSVWDAISDLPPLESGQGIEETTLDSEAQNFYQMLMRNSSGKLFNHISSVHKISTIEKMKMIKPGMTQKDLPEEFQTRSVHSGAYGRMEKEHPSYTLTTRLNTPSVGRIIHPEQHRTITPREASRLQSFKDKYRFLGDVTSIGKQIGNAVPPLMSQAIAKSVVDILTSKDLDTMINESDFKITHQSDIFEILNEVEPVLLGK
ncbi:DNA (cytosine-5-)-methyltransferase [Peribacillus sp. ACCC06369]|uniref:DNA (cytosine-5-)-methyltransferase n=1 Tax=Peribacillus sp. ACCC06369 TaxID=3055860 RepID=UPI0025A1D4BF|nr:DNA (cytosine-5-)-methyltransferase [Peribacillus sp. ACCC06369]MDM5360422.1 DNA (cytosine-5-)-methyltransferase [Peribacillus sp. ACCC06369]